VGEGGDPDREQNDDEPRHEGGVGEATLGATALATPPSHRIHAVRNDNALIALLAEPVERW
jgi:hypothetical protein